MVKSKLVKTETVTDVISETQRIGDYLATKFHETQDLRMASICLAAYKTAINGSKAQLGYKKLTSNKERIAFLHTSKKKHS